MSKCFSISSVARPAVLVAAICGAALAQSARADFSTAQSDSYGVRANLTALSLVGVNVGPASVASGAAPAPYSQHTSVASLSANTLTVASLLTGLIVTDAASNVDGTAGPHTASAAAVVNGLNLNIVPGVLVVPDLVHLGATTISSNAQVGGVPGAFNASGGFNIENLSLVVAGVGTISVNANAAPNTVLLDALGIRIVANEQIVTGDGSSFLGLTVNALHITIDGALNTVGGDVVIAHSYAQQAVPAPSVAGLLISGVGIVGLRRRR